MTAFLAGLAVGTLAGAAFTCVCWWRKWHRWTDQHAYDRVRLEVTRVDLLWRDKDSAERRARRWETREHIARQHIGDLTIQLDRARRRRTAMPVYGSRRQQVTA